uniref:Coilin tudor domain-containing protein n=1 Tax=Tanacetum cinerariifolium TaxID=118510 RepID=A0A6L2MQR9_TANCI|nr:hypothetical protein [Tanacetum cinerariifolium]
MASEGSNPDAEYALSKLLQRGTVADYQNEFEMLISQVTGKSKSFFTSIYIFGPKPSLQRALLWSNPTTLREAFSLARIAEARFKDERSITDIAKINDLNAGVHRHPQRKEWTTVSNEVVVGLPNEFQEGDMVDALSIVEQKSLGNPKELDYESKDRKVERDAKREREPTILAIFSSDRAVVDFNDFEKLPLYSSPKEGDVIAYHVLELTSSWTPELTSFWVRKVTHYDGNIVVLMSVQEYPIVLDKMDEDTLALLNVNELAVVDLNDFEKLPLYSSPKEGGVIAYHVLELTSSWTPELTSFWVVIMVVVAEGLTMILLVGDTQ